MHAAPTEARAAPHARYAAGESLGAKITALCRNLYTSTYRLLVLIREFDENGYWQLAGHASCAHWLHFECGIGLGAAREKVRVAHALAGLAKVSDAFAQGALSYSKVRAMTRIADENNEDFLLRAARHGTAADVERLVSQSRSTSAGDENARAHARYRSRSVTVRYELDGSMVLQARLPAEDGALVMQALGLARERAWAERNDAEGKGNVGSEDDEKGDDEKEDDVSAETPAREPVTARDADALIDVVECYLETNRNRGSNGDRYQVVVHVSAETLKSGNGVGSPAVQMFADRSYLEGGPRVSAETSRRLACDGSRVVVAEDDEGEPLSIGRRTRAIPPAIRRALQIRDGHCRFPGCTSTRVDAHHIVHWADGGETSLENLVLECRHHHRLLHEGGFSCERLPDGSLVFRDALGQELPASGRLAL